MAIVVDQVDIGGMDNTAGPFTFNTSAAVASGGFIVLTIGWYDAAATAVLDSVSGGSLTWTIDKQANDVLSGNHNTAIVSAQAPSGLSSGTTITFTFSSGPPDLVSGHGTSFTGVATSNPVDGTPTGPTSDDLTWSTASYAIAAGSVIVAICLTATDDSHTITSPSVQSWQWFIGSEGVVGAYRIETSAGSYTVSGTWTSAGNTSNIAVAYKVPTATAQVLPPSADSVDGNWTDQSGGTSLFAAIDETTPSDSDWIESEMGPQDSACRVKLTAGGDPASSTGHEINWRIAKDSAGGQTVNMTVKLYQGGGNSIGGGTLIATFNRNDVGASFTDYTETLSGAEADSITDYTDLYLEFLADT